MLYSCRSANALANAFSFSSFSFARFLKNASRSRCRIRMSLSSWSTSRHSSLVRDVSLWYGTSVPGIPSPSFRNSLTMGLDSAEWSIPTGWSEPATVASAVPAGVASDGVATVWLDSAVPVCVTSGWAAVLSVAGVALPCSNSCAVVCSFEIAGFCVDTVSCAMVSSLFATASAKTGAAVTAPCSREATMAAARQCLVKYDLKNMIGTP